jgi:PPK2 family polyphosphate:nucleotide phosphotransferase
MTDYSQNTDNLFRLNKKFLVKPGMKIKLKDYDTSYTAGYHSKEEAQRLLESDVARLSDLQERFYADKTYSLLIIFQAMDAAGKDGTIKHVMTGLNPQGCRVYSFIEPSSRELAHDFLWRHYAALPEKGMIVIFNRSYYEEVTAVKVHPEFILKQNIPGIKEITDITTQFWNKRYESINQFEKTINDSGTIILKFFFHVSKEEQKRRFLKRIDDADKNWKFSMEDIYQRKFWNDFQKAYEDAINNTSTEYAPWFIIPADKKWFMRMVVGDIIAGTLDSLNLKYPKLSKDYEEKLKEARAQLLAED